LPIKNELFVKVDQNRCGLKSNDRPTARSFKIDFKRRMISTLMYVCRSNAINWTNAFRLYSISDTDIITI